MASPFVATARDPPPRAARDPRASLVPLAIMCLSLVLVVMSVSGLNTALPTMQQDLDASASELQWIVDSYAIVFAGLLLSAGAIGDRFGRKGALLGGLAVFGVAAVLGRTCVELWPADRQPCRHGHRCRLHHAGDAVDHHVDLPAA